MSLVENLRLSQRHFCLVLPVNAYPVSCLRQPSPSQGSHPPILFLRSWLGPHTQCLPLRQSCYVVSFLHSLTVAHPRGTCPETAQGQGSQLQWEHSSWCPSPYGPLPGTPALLSGFQSSVTHFSSPMATSTFPLIST